MTPRYRDRVVADHEDRGAHFVALVGAD